MFRKFVCPSDRRCFLRIRSFAGFGVALAFVFVSASSSWASSRASSAPYQPPVQVASGPAAPGQAASSSKTPLAAQPDSNLIKKLWNAYATLFSRIGAKIVQIHRSDVENVSLRQENAELRIELETRIFEQQSQVARIRTQELGVELEGETGIAIGRTLASIQYEVPPQVQPRHLHTLAVTYFKAGENEKAAKILHFLLGLPSGEFRTSKNLMMAAILWYRLDNLRISDSLFSELTHGKGAKVSSSMRAQAELWRALVARKKGSGQLEQTRLQALLSAYPHSREAKWVNVPRVNGSKEARRVPAQAN